MVQLKSVSNLAALEAQSEPDAMHLPSGGISTEHSGPLRPISSTREMRAIAMLIALFISSGPYSVCSPASLGLYFVISGSCLQILVDRYDYRLVTLAAIVLVGIVSSSEVYLHESTIPSVLAITLIISSEALLLIAATRNLRKENDTIGVSKVYAATTLIFKHLLDQGILPLDGTTEPSIQSTLRRTFFTIAFMLSIMSLWLQAIGIRLLNSRNCKRDIFRCWASLLATILHCIGAGFSFAYIVVAAYYSASEVPFIIKLAFTALGFWTIAVFF
ncbi:hypothetical protein ACEPAF_7599 [Sanghuangporus sanghuang]